MATSSQETSPSLDQVQNLFGCQYCQKIRDNSRKPCDSLTLIQLFSLASQHRTARSADCGYYLNADNRIVTARQNKYHVR